MILKRGKFYWYEFEFRDAATGLQPVCSLARGIRV